MNEYKLIIKEIFIANLKRLMAANGIKTQLELANLLKAEQSTVNTWFSVRVKGLPDPAQMQKISAYFGVPAESLVNTEGFDALTLQAANLMRDLPEDKKREVLAYIEERRLLAELKKT